MVKMDCVGFSKPIEAALRKLAPLVPKPLQHLTVIAVTDTEMRQLNTHYRNKNMTTDVLTFVYDPRHADIYMSLAVASVQAAIRHVTLVQECQRLLVHGICHALDMNHHTVPEFQEMRKREFELLVQCVQC